MKTYSATSFTSFWKVELSITYMMPLANIKTHNNHICMQQNNNNLAIYQQCSLLATKNKNEIKQLRKTCSIVGIPCTQNHKKLAKLMHELYTCILHYILKVLLMCNNSNTAAIVSHGKTKAECV